MTRGEARAWIVGLLERLMGQPLSGLDLVAVEVLADATDSVDEAFVRGWNARGAVVRVPMVESPAACFPDPDLFRRCGTHHYMPLYPDGRCAEGLGR